MPLVVQSICWTGPLYSRPQWFKRTTLKEDWLVQGAKAAWVEMEAAVVEVEMAGPEEGEDSGVGERAASFRGPKVAMAEMVPKAEPALKRVLPTKEAKAGREAMSGMPGAAVRGLAVPSRSAAAT